MTDRFEIRSLTGSDNFIVDKTNSGFLIDPICVECSFVDFETNQIELDLAGTWLSTQQEKVTAMVY